MQHIFNLQDNRYWSIINLGISPATALPAKRALAFCTHFSISSDAKFDLADQP
jgi:hypothetical protein